MEYLRPGEDSRENWKAINEIEARRRELEALLGISQYDGAKVNIKPGLWRSGMHPFKIYQYPWNLRAAVDADDWRRFRVRSGQVLESAATATDGEPFPDGNMFPAGADEVTVPASTAKFWFWLEIGESSGATTAVVRWHSDPTQDEYDGGEDGIDAAWGPTGNPWTLFPKHDSGHVPIGWVDTLTKAADKVALVRQLIRADVIGLGGGAGVECPYG